jgi:hypothetical protein
MLSSVSAADLHTAGMISRLPGWSVPYLLGSHKSPVLKQPWSAHAFGPTADMSRLYLPSDPLGHSSGEHGKRRYARNALRASQYLGQSCRRLQTLGGHGADRTEAVQ